MNTREFLQKLLVQDIRVSADGDRLRVNAPHDVLTAELRSELAARKIEIRTFLEALALKRSSLVPLQPAGSRPAFYGVLADGDVFSYLQLSRQLGPDQPFYAFEAPGIDGAQPPLTSIEALAACYLADLRAFQPDGPYFVGGFCLGGIVAFELARQLSARGRTWLYSPSSKARRRVGSSPGMARLPASAAGDPRFLSGCATYPANRGQSGSLSCRAVSRGFFAAAIRRPPPSRRVPGCFRATLEAAYAYVLEHRSYPGRIVLFQGSQELKRRRAYLRQLDWARVAAGGLEVNVGLDGCSDYKMMLLDPPHVGALADLLKPYLGHPPRRSPAPS